MPEPPPPAPSKPEYSPPASQCQISTTASRTGSQSAPRTRSTSSEPMVRVCTVVVLPVSVVTSVVLARDCWSSPPHALSSAPAPTVPSVPGLGDG